VSALVAADVESTYEPYPILKYSEAHTPLHRQHSVRSVGKEELGSADPIAQHNPRQEDNELVEGLNLVQKQISGTELYVHKGRTGYVFTVCLDTNLAEKLVCISWYR
jgi:hypothetical protein